MNKSDELKRRWATPELRRVYLYHLRRAQRSKKREDAARVANLKNFKDGKMGRFLAASKRLHAQFSPDNVTARCWSIKHPSGTVFQFRNVAAFVEQNTHLFTPEELALSRQGKRKIAEMLRKLSPRGKHPSQTVHGWTWHIDHESVDLLNREYQA